MTQSATFVGWLLVLGTVLGLAMVGHPALIRIWTIPREQHVAAVSEHRTVWAFLNAGFVLATVATAAALLAMGPTLYIGTEWEAPLLACGMTYAIGGGLWCAVLAIRTRTTPLLHELGPTSYNTAPVRVLDAAAGGMFQAFVLICSTALAALGVVLLLAGGVSAAVCLVTIVIGVGAIVTLLITGDVVPAALYIPTLMIGVALLAGWT